ncbi:response regulator [Phenylobacterium sp. J426]|uniref:response regulator n=1 Tax=Phenylobacterium sp. J426 TaxID=2898439 RepID=UPI002151ADAE|nr:response regulator [Phenylobacterium sp. J426]MCR5873847.1 response regulator [Phenylobacterium sp. J426]
MSTLKILYVDDEPDIREVACLSLEMDPDMEVRAAASAEEALALLDAAAAAGAWAPDLFLLDVMMPGTDGPTLLKAIRERPQFDAAPAVFITARAQRQESERLMGLGAVAVIAKPFDPMSLAAEVKAAAGRA